MLNYEDFKAEVKENFKCYLSKENQNGEVTVTPIQKNNVTLDGLSIRNPDTNMCPQIYVEDLYENYKNSSFDKAMEHAAELYETALEEMKNLPVNGDNITERLKPEFLMPFLCDYNKNKEMLAGCPYKRVEDMAVYYRFDLKMGVEGTATIELSHQVANMLGLDEDKLFDLAMTNFKTYNKPRIESLSDIAKELMVENFMEFGMSKEMAEEMADKQMPVDMPSQIVVTNQTRLAAASYMLDNDVLNTVAEKLGDDFYILPSSVHEFICVPMKENNVGELLKTVCAVNGDKSIMDDKDILTDSVYAYEKGSRGIVKALSAQKENSYTKQ